MQRHALDEGVFIRSLATRGQLGGLSRSTFDVVMVLDAMGFDRVLVETVGVGQDEVDVMRAAHTTCVVTVPGLGDDIQAIKAGILEIAEVLVVNKADREGADRTVRDLFQMLELRGPGGLHQIEVVKTIAAWGLREGSGIAELVAAIEGHRAGQGSVQAAAAARRRAEAHLAEMVRALLADRAAEILANAGGLGGLAERIAAGEIDPYSAAESVLARV
jgi:LAO/AO transport system kinase